MFYRARRFFGESGEVSPTLRSAGTPPGLVTKSVRKHGLATHASTMGEFGLYRVDAASRVRR